MTGDRPIRVVHLDDESTVLSTTENYFARFADDISVETTTEPEQALSQVERGEIDCLLCDYEMPAMDGLAVLERLKQQELDVPFVMYTGKGSEIVASEAISQGAADYVRKDEGMAHYEHLADAIREAVWTSAGEGTGGDEPDPERKQELEHAETIFENVQDAIFLIDVTEGPEFRIQRVNEAYEETTGLSAAEMRGKTPRELLGEQAGSEIESRYRECVNRKESITYEETLPLGGERTYWDTKLTPIIEDGRVTQLVGATRNITEQKERQQELETLTQRLDLALEGTDTGVWEWTVDTDAVFWSETTHRLFGIEPGEFGGTFEAFAEYVHPADIDRVTERLERALAAGEPFEAEYRIVREDGEEVWIAVEGELHDRDGTERMVGIATDVTDRKETELQLRESQRKLDQIGENIDDVVWMNTPDQDGIEFITDAYEEIWGRPVAELEENPQAFVEAIHPEDRDHVLAAMDAQQDDPDSYDETYRVVQPDGTIRWVRDRSSGVYTDDGELERIVGIATDITARRERQQNLIESESRFRSLAEALDTSTIGTFILDDELDVVWANEMIEEYFGLDRGAIVGADKEQLIHAEIKEIFAEPDRFTERVTDTYSATDRVAEFECHVLAGDGRDERWLLHRSAPIEYGQYAGGRVEQYTDITDRKQRQQELATVRNQLDIALAETDTGVWLYDLDTETVTPYGKTTDLFGVDPATTTVSSYLDTIHPGDRDVVEAAIERAIETTGEYEAEFRVEDDGDERWLRGSGKVITDESGTATEMIGVTTDISAQKEREQRLQTIRYRFERFAGNVQDAFFLMSPDYAETEYVNPVVEDIYGITPAEAYDDPENWLKHVHPADKGQLEAGIAERTRGTADWPVDEEFRVQHPERGTQWVQTRLDAITDDNGTVTQITGVATDITERKEREQELEASESRFRAVFENAHDALVIADDDGEYVAANSAACDLFGVDRDQLLGKTIRAFSPPDFDFEAAWQEFMESDTTRGEFPLVRPDGDRRIVEFSATRDILPGRHLSALRDVTERREHEREIERQNERLELLASTISHDLRNPLRSAQSHLAMARKTPDDDLLAEVERGHERMEELIDDLLTLARQGEAVSETERVDIATAAEEAFDGIEAPRATLETDGKPVPADRTRLVQLFQNLLANSVEHGREDVTIRVGSSRLGFFVADDGPGIPGDEREDVFEYGYTTTETGTGFGLAIVGEIAEAHGWDVSVTESESGGARFEFRT